MAVVMQTELLKLIENFDVISFDVFDTLLLRPYLNPTDLFRKIGGEAFRRDRVLAEREARDEARAAGREEIALDDIYAKLPRWCDLKERELEEERRCLVANPEIVEIFNCAKAKGCKAVIASDMYLPRSFLESVLRGNGIDGWDGLYLSSDRGVQKTSGRLFECIAREMDIPLNRILHIGDDECADLVAPEKIGVGTWFYSKVRESFFAENPYIDELIARHPGTLWRDFVGAIVLAWQLERCRAEYCTRQKLACVFGGVILYAFVTWMIADARLRGIRRFLFVARDGYTPRRLVKTFAPDFETDYVYAPRSVSVPVRAGEPVRPDYREYVRSLGIDPKTTAIVDGNTECYSSQRLIEACLSAPLMGYYFIRTSDNDHAASYFNLLRQSEFCPYMFLEALYCAPSLPVKDVREGRPMYFEGVLPYERIRAEHYPAVSDAIVRAATLYRRIELTVDSKVLLSWLDAFIQEPPLSDRMCLIHLKNATDVGHENYRSVRFVKRATIGWKRAFLFPVRVISRSVEGCCLVERVRLLGVIPLCLRYRIAHEWREKWCSGDILNNLDRWLRSQRIWGVICLVYRFLRHNGEVAAKQ